MRALALGLSLGLGGTGVAGAAPVAAPLTVAQAGAPAPSNAPASPGAARPAPSAEDEAAGRRHYKRGDELFKQGKFLDAAREFEAGFAVAPRPLFLLNIGHSYRRAQELRRARAAYEEFLKADPTSAFRADVEDLMKSIDDALGVAALPVGPPPPTSGATTSPAPAPSTTPPPLLPSAAPPPPPPSASPPTSQIDLAPPVIVSVDEPPPAASESRSLFKSPWFWGAVGVVVAAAVGGTVYGLNRTPVCPATRCLRESN